MFAGVNMLADAVKATLGPNGRNAVLERPLAEAGDNRPDDEGPEQLRAG